MNNALSVRDVVDLLAELVRGEVTEEGGGYTVIGGRGDKQYTLRTGSREIDEVLERLLSLEVHEEIALCDDVSYEIVIKEESGGGMRRMRGREVKVVNDADGVEYELSAISGEYLVWLLREIQSEYKVRDLPGAAFAGMRIERFLSEEGGNSLVDCARYISLRHSTLKIRTRGSTSKKRFVKLAYAFLFQLGYNLDVALVPLRSLEELTRSGRMARMRRSRFSEIEPPRRVYSEELVQHYLLAVSTDNPVMEYLSFYHILEHFYEAVFNDELLEAVRGKITDPGFSYKRKQDVKKLVTYITKSLQVRSETITFSEKEALRLCLRRYVEMDGLVARLKEYDEAIVAYYKHHEVEFSSGGSTVDLENSDENVVLRSLARRIYNTRNALVHSKSGDREKYTPFKDEAALLKELPLLRFISESIIISNSRVM